MQDIITKNIKERFNRSLQKRKLEEISATICNCIVIFDWYKLHSLYFS